MIVFIREDFSVNDSSDWFVILDWFTKVDDWWAINHANHPWCINHSAWWLGLQSCNHLIRKCIFPPRNHWWTQEISLDPGQEMHWSYSSVIYRRLLYINQIAGWFMWDKSYVFSRRFNCVTITSITHPGLFSSWDHQSHHNYMAVTQNNWLHDLQSFEKV